MQSLFFVFFLQLVIYFLFLNIWQTKKIKLVKHNMYSYIYNNYGGALTVMVMFFGNEYGDPS